MATNGTDELSRLTAPAAETTSNGDVSEYGSLANSEATPSLKKILASAPSDLRGSMQSLKGMINDHTGTLELPFWFC